MNDMRQHLREEFLSSCNLERNEIEPLAEDASFRRYFRVQADKQSYILMDAPPEHEDIQPFIKIAKHLMALELNAPEIYQYDKNNGFILLQDFGDNTFTRLLAQDYDEHSLYELALNSLIHLQQHPQASAIELPSYSNELLINEALLLPDWYYPRQNGDELSTHSRLAYIECWINIFDSLPELVNTLVLRDFHVDNLISLDNGDCGLLDFQDAVIGSPAYDLVSLLEDARRDIPQSLQVKMLDFYFSQLDYNLDDFMRWYHALGAQRHCKVLGIFTRLSVRDGKHHYLTHLDRVQRLLATHLNQTDLLPLKTWFHENNLIKDI